MLQLCGKLWGKAELFEQKDTGEKGLNNEEKNSGGDDNDDNNNKNGKQWGQKQCHRIGNNIESKKHAVAQQVCDAVRPSGFCAEMRLCCAKTFLCTSSSSQWMRHNTPGHLRDVGRVVRDRSWRVAGGNSNSAFITS